MNGEIEFRVWAPDADAVELVLPDGAQPMGREGEIHAATIRADRAVDYAFALEGRRLPDPCSRFQPDGVRGLSRVVDTSAFEIAPGPPLTLDDLVIYELHVGTFSDEGTFAGAVPHLADLRELGVTAIEVMPIATFPGERNWGYDGVYTYAPHPVYGGPEGFAGLVDAAHREGLGVILDVVYNHIGPGSEAIAAFGPYFTDRYDTFWGDALDYARRGVREWAVQNAELWTRDYRVDGLRLDAVHAIFDESEPHVLRELRDRVRGLVISEMEIGDYRPIEAWGHDAQWDDRLHHELHVALTGEQDGYYQGYGTPGGLARALAVDPRSVVCAQNHDQVGNRAVGDRLPGGKLALAASIACLSRGTPLLFMGEEYGEPNPFQFFTDHVDPAIAEATRQGRRKEFEGFAGFAGEVPDPQDEQTFVRSKLSRRETPGTRELYRQLLRQRRERG